MPNNSKPYVWRGQEVTRKEIAELEYVTLDTDIVTGKQIGRAHV